MLLATACNSTKKINSTMRAIDAFKPIITGDFDNRQQVDAEIKAGKQVHPFARHVNRVANDKISNLPANLNGFFILEESYYEYPGKAMEVKPYLFLFTDAGADNVRLTVYQIPAAIKKEDFTNANTALQLDYTKLQPSPTFKGADYQYNRQAGAFSTNAHNELGNGMRFTLIETLSPNKLEVMELLEKNGQRLTPYDTPIIYDRK